MPVLSLIVICICAIVVLYVFAALFFKVRRSTLRDMSLLEDAFDLSGYGVVLFDRRGQFVMANSRARDYLPVFGSDSLAYAKLQDFLDYMFDHAVEYDERIQSALSTSSEEGKGHVFREVVLGRNSRLYLVEMQKNDTRGSVLTVMDVSDVKRREEDVLRLSQSNYELHHAVEAVDNGIIVMQPQEQGASIIFANRGVCEIFRMNSDALLGRDIDIILNQLADKAVRHDIKSCLRAQHGGEFEVCVGDEYVEGVRWYDFRITSVLQSGQAGAHNLIVGVFTDTTMLKVREAEISKAQKLEALGQMAAGVAHDFNNVLSIIDGYARMAASVPSDGNLEKNEKYLARIRMASQRGASLVKQMLTFSRHKIVAEDVISLGDVVKEQEALLAPLLDASIQFMVLTDSKEMVVECAPDTISQILMNLVVNARDAMPGGGRVLIETRFCPANSLPEIISGENAAHDFACFSVSDTGEGMSKSVVERMFDPFFTTKGQGEGTGLGLSMVYGLAQQMGAYIDVRSSLGRGTQISIYIKLSDKPLNRIAKGDVSDPNTIELKGYTALVCEDEPDLLLLVSQMLEGLGMKVLTASNGHEALVLQDEHEGAIDVLLTDIVMPELDGLKTADLILALRPDMRVVFMSGYPANGKMAKIELPKDACFLAKPVKYEILSRVIYQQITQSLSGGLSDAEAAHWDDGLTISRKGGAVS